VKDLRSALFLRLAELGGRIMLIEHFASEREALLRDWNEIAPEVQREAAAIKEEAGL
jgi:hypothetical protein